MDSKLKHFVKSILLRGLTEDVANLILDSEYAESFYWAFVTKNVNREKNYEFFEQIGDLTINKFVVNYICQRFPQLKSSRFVSVLATAKKIYSSKSVLSMMSEKFFLDQHVICTNQERINKSQYKNILEDVFEAFFGALEYTADSIWGIGMGYICTWKILKSMYDELLIKIDYKSMVDSKTRLNELKDEYKIEIEYQTNKSGIFFNTKVLLTYNNYNKTEIGFGSHTTKKESEIIASEEALTWLENTLDMKKDVPEAYRYFSGHTWV